jgi:phosphoribosyl 1,2-cyclic phosphate phosphodiesterase
LEKLKGVEVLVLNALRRKEHISHFSLSEALDMVKVVAPKRALFTHISHLMGKHEEVSEILPEGVALAYDGLTVQV